MNEFCDFQTNLDEAENFILKKLYSSALDELRQIPCDDLSLKGIRLCMSIGIGDEDLISQIREFFEIIIKVKPSLKGEAYYILGDLFAFKKDKRTARKFFRKAYYNGFDGALLLATNLLDVGEYKLTIMICEKFLNSPEKNNPNHNGPLYRLMAEASIKLEKFDDAIVYLEKAVCENSVHLHSCKELALIHEELQEKGKAKDLWQNIVAMGAGNSVSDRRIYNMAISRLRRSWYA